MGVQNESQNSSFMAGQNDQNYSNNDSSDEEHSRLSHQHNMRMEPQEETKGEAGLSK